MAYIYKITNKINQKIYIGKTEFSVEKRWKQHCSDAFKSENQNRPLYAAIKKYGIDNFLIEVIEETNQANEREIYWIEYFQSFKNGYNATKGGDGKKYIDYDLVIATYKELKSQKLTAEKLNIHPDSVYKILHSHNINIYHIPYNNKIVNMYDKNTNVFLKSFSSLGEAAQYCIDNNFTNCKFSTIRYHISEVCNPNKNRKTAAGFIWKFGDINN